MLRPLVAGLAIAAAALPLSPAHAQADAVRQRQWPLAALSLQRAWQISTGQGVTVAVLDTGVDDRHPDLAGQIVHGPDYTGVDSRGTAHWGRHGTQMASLIAGRGHGPAGQQGIMGVAPGAKIMSVRVTLENTDPARDTEPVRERSRHAVAQGIRYAVDHGATVISMSLGGGQAVYEGNATEEEAVQYAVSKGAVLIASSGNDGANDNRKNFPAAYPGVIAVGAVDRSLQRATFSNSQTYLSVMAPGTQIVSADGAAGYVVGDGTSAAAAHVAGIAALVRAVDPSLTSQQVRRAIEQGTVRRPEGGHDPAYGNGVADAYEALVVADRMRRRLSTAPAMPAPTPADYPTTRPVAPSPAQTAVGEYFGGGPEEPSGVGRRLIGGLLLIASAAISVAAVATLRRRRLEAAADRGETVEIG